MRNVGLFVGCLLIFISCSGCNRKPGRPDTFLCTFLSQAGIWECENGSHVIKQETPEGLACTPWDDYAVLERYVDSKEKKVRELERQLAQCRKSVK